jgi:signal transduction histidine kinase/CheY-like chemotaxis protein
MRLRMRLMVAMTTLVLAAVAAVGVLAYYNIGRAVGPAGVQRLADQTKARIGAIDALLSTVKNEVLGARTFPAHQGVVRARLNGGLDPQDGFSEARWRRHLAEAYAGQMSAKPGILRYRFIGFADGGRELVRVERSEAGVRIVPDNELEQQGAKEVFLRGQQLAEDGIFLSWGRRHGDDGGDDATPATRVLFATPVHTVAGEPFGLIVLELDMRPTFERIRAALSEDTKSYIVDPDGPYLVNLREGRIVPNSQSRRWQDDFPDLAKSLGDKPGTATILTAPDRQRVAAVLGFTTLPGGQRVGVIETAAFDRIMAPATALQSSSLIVALVAAIVAVLVSVFLSRSLAEPIVRITAAVDAFDRSGRLTLPANLTGEVEVLAGAFARMVGRIDATNFELRSKSEQLDKTIASMADAVLVIGADGHRVFGNPPAKALFGDFTSFGTEHRQCAIQRVGSDGFALLSEAESPANRARQGESFDNVEIGIRRSGQPLMHLSASGRPIENPDGSFGGAVIVYRNVTKLRDAERQLRHAHKMQAIGQLTGGVAHDLNNILTVVTGGIEILAEGVADRPDLKEVAGMVDQAVARATDLTNSLLSFARKQPLQPRSIDVNALVLDTLKLLRPTIGAQIEIEVDCAPDLKPALADPSQLGNALVNLAINARDSMRGGGQLLLRTANIDLDEAYAEQHDEVAAGRYVMLEVGDTGTGISPAIRDRVFEPFFTTKPVGKGTGLGLSMVYGFAKQSGGHIELSSEDGRGTTIRLYLPCAPVPETSTEAAAVSPSNGGQERVLVVEDDRLVRGYVMSHLAALGYAAFAAATAAEAMALIENGLQFDLLFTDVMLPGHVDGLQLANDVRRRRPGVKVLFTSGFSQAAMRQQGRLDPGMQLLAKPYRRAELARTLRLVLDAKLEIAAT